jgi:hypothetical protein
MMIRSELFCVWLYRENTFRTGNFRSSHASVLRTIKTFSNIEINDAARVALRTFSVTIPAETCQAITNSPFSRRALVSEFAT